MGTNRLLGEFSELESSVAVLDGEMGELSLILPAWQIAVLEAKAHSLGITTAQMVRHLIHDSFLKYPVLATCKQ